MKKKLLIMFFVLSIISPELKAQDTLSHWSVVGKVGLDYYRVTPVSTEKGIDNYIDDMGWTFPGVFIEYTINPLVGFGGGIDYLTYNRNTAKGNTLDFTLFGSVNLANLLVPKRTGFWSRANVYGNFGAGLGFYSNELFSTGKIKKLMSPLFTSALSFEYNLSKAWALQVEAQRRYYTREDLGGMNSSSDITGTTGGMTYGNDAAVLTIGLRYKFGTKNKKHVRNMTVLEYHNLNDSNIIAVQERIKAIEGQNAANIEKIKNMEEDLKALRDERAADKAKLQEYLKDIPQAKVASNSDSIIVLLDVNFEFGSSKLEAKAQTALDQVALVLKVNKSWSQLLVSGYTDYIGSDKVNNKLSMERAVSVKNYLISKGIASSVINTAGFGKQKPKAPNSTNEGRYLNRRAEVIIEK